MNEAEVIRGMLDGKTIAVVGLSDDPIKPSHYVSAYMQAQGYRILPVNPGLAASGASVLGERVYASLNELPVKPDVVDVFRLANAIPGIVDEMLALGLKNLWVQQGIVNVEVAKKAEQGGIRVVMDRCIMVEHRNSG
jgi:predicted CoA-binding protein